ncbi:hypothetical protein H9Q10_08415 [Eikenella sp. S3360]|uniref:MORN repeat variant n=1 Tax=Eikenella glucosivorans TaxID=2766967 RepID=A0ABS0NBN0_9NEIS|nr:hypothetical protein [Eikenella glucosivorans]
MFYESGKIKFRYSRYLSPNNNWIRHGLFEAFYKNGIRASEGNYEHGAEHETWTDYHDDGSLAARGTYRHGEQLEDWEYWDK